ncbi:MAG: FAD-dependent oxidoreductase [Patescibacteria group bacterium]
MAVSLELPIIGRSIVAEKTAEILLGLEDAQFDFIAGQYARVTILNPTYEDSRNNSREFSIASSPNEKKYLKIAFRISESGFKKNILETQLGTKVMIEGPFGVFVLPKDHLRPIVFIAGGIGITPFLSMATFAAENKSAHKIILLYANGSQESAPYLGELKELEARNPNFLLRDKIGPLDDSFILESAGERLAPNSPCLWYIAGPPGMAQAARQILLRNAVEEKNIYTEEFSGYEPK